MIVSALTGRVTHLLSVFLPLTNFPSFRSYNHSYFSSFWFCLVLFFYMFCFCCCFPCIHSNYGILLSSRTYSTVFFASTLPLMCQHWLKEMPLFFTYGNTIAVFELKLYFSFVFSKYITVFLLQTSLNHNYFHVSFQLSVCCVFVKNLMLLPCWNYVSMKWSCMQITCHDLHGTKPDTRTVWLSHDQKSYPMVLSQWFNYLYGLVYDQLRCVCVLVKCFCLPQVVSQGVHLVLP